MFCSNEWPISINGAPKKMTHNAQRISVNGNYISTFSVNKNASKSASLISELQFAQQGTVHV